MLTIIRADWSPQMRSPARQGAEPADIWKARKFIQEYSDDHLSLGDVAKAVNISPNYLSEKFKQVTGENFVNYVAGLRFEKACMLLRSGDLRTSEIAFAVGFQSLSQFNRVFKKLSGKSPTEFRAALTARGVTNPETGSRIRQKGRRPKERRTNPPHAR